MTVAMWMMVMIWTSKYVFDTNNKTMLYFYCFYGSESCLPFLI